MPEYLSPGVYVEEIDTGNKPIEGVSTSTVGFLGMTERGPTKATLVGSFSEYARVFGKYISPGFLPYAVEGFFQNGGKRCFIARVVSPQATSILALADMELHANGPGDWPNNGAPKGGRLAVVVSAAGVTNPNVAATAALFKLTVFYWDSSAGLPVDPPLDPTVAANLRDPNYRSPTLVETYDNLAADATSSNFYEVRINNVSDLITAKSNGPAPPAAAPLTLFPNVAAGPALTLQDFTGDPEAEPGTETGLAALEQVDEISILCCPDEFGHPFPDFRNHQPSGRAVREPQVPFRHPPVSPESRPGG